MKKILLNNIGLKLLAFLLAFITWFYIEGATKPDSEKTVLRKLFSRASYSSKKLYIKPIFIGAVPAGYKFSEDDVTVTPEFILVVGPSKILEKKENLFTKPIDLREHTKSKVLDMELVSVSPAIKLQKTEIQVYLAIEKEK